MTSPLQPTWALSTGGSTCSLASLSISTKMTLQPKPAAAGKSFPSKPMSWMQGKGGEKSHQILSFPQNPSVLEQENPPSLSSSSSEFEIPPIFTLEICALKNSAPCEVLCKPRPLFSSLLPTLQSRGQLFLDSSLHTRDPLINLFMKFPAWCASLIGRS